MVLIRFIILTILFSVYLIAAPKAQCGKVVAVHDGDTFTFVGEDHKKIKVRVAYVDCPELDQKYGSKAKDFSSKLINNQLVCLIIKYYDPFKRAVALVKLKNGKLLNEELLAKGYAWHYKKYSHRSDYQQLENNAKASGRGLWGKSNPVAPWEWRKNKQKNRRVSCYFLKQGLYNKG